jgi:hypothetical protein
MELKFNTTFSMEPIKNGIFFYFVIFLGGCNVSYKLGICSFFIYRENKYKTLIGFYQNVETIRKKVVALELEEAVSEGPKLEEISNEESIKQIGFSQ